MRATSKHLQIQGRSAKVVFILQMQRNIVSLFKRFGRRVFQNRTSFSFKTLLVIGQVHQKSLNSVIFYKNKFILWYNHTNLKLTR